MFANAVNLAADSTFNATFWLALAGILATLLGTVGAGILSYRATKSTAESAASAQLALKQEEERASTRSGKRREKLAAIDGFMDAADAYWQMENDLWDRVKNNEPIRSFRAETATATARLTQSKIKLELVSGKELRDAVNAYVDAMVETAKAVSEEHKWSPPDKGLYHAMMDRGRDELNYENV
ncbi:hypothetical protein AB0I68_05690 [Streptomyces sp. NPDC050448]|uniref:hypothetical protein n=1 Tax=Streptomyces sp. NPDC050448 TaxID=3155404 RepID=UPI003442E14B